MDGTRRHAIGPIRPQPQRELGYIKVVICLESYIDVGKRNLLRVNP